MNILELVFYAFTFVALSWEIFVYNNPQKLLTFTTNFRNKGLNLTLLNNKEVAYWGLSVGYFFWVFIGLFTFQWYLFLTILILSIVMVRNNIESCRVDAVLTIILLSAILLNKIF